MSKNRYFLNSPNDPNLPLLRNELHKALAQREFIVEIPVTEDNIIEIKEENSNAKLKKVFIKKLNYSGNNDSKVEKIWKVDLEKDIPGISPIGKTPECAILVLQKYESSYRLSIILIELKSTIDNKELQKIGEKFQCAMSRIYMLLVLNNHLNSIQGYNESQIYIDFKGILFYQTFSDRSKFTEKDNDKLYLQMYSILQTSDKSGILTCETILKPQDKINIKCFTPQDNHNLEPEMRINLQSLLSK
ncbi:MAG: hypothetical protein HEQ30_22300 [Dolichospermum sp. OL01]|jgi:hypothetical protein|nr:hypothetical protein [Dolichospermum sp. WA123]MBS9395742.1 hypothetical protein [Dolichospermum sp. OL01]